MKLTLVSIVVHGIQHSAFIYLKEGSTVTWEILHDVFPGLSSLPRGTTISIG